MPSIPCWQVDAFTERPFGGNPAAVCWLEHPAPDAWMQAVAAEMNLSETAFVEPRDDGYGLRWFTPKTEVSLCGHATLASAFVIWHTGLDPEIQPLRFHTRSGELTCRREAERIVMDFPASPLQPIPPPAELLEALGGGPAVFTGRSNLDHLVVLPSADQVRSLAPDIGRLRQFPTRGVIVTSRSDDPQFDFVSRFFAPAVGVDEDPVTGSAHCCLAPYWAGELGKSTMRGFQASPRGGSVEVRLEGNRVLLGGRAVLVWQGELLAIP